MKKFWPVGAVLLVVLAIGGGLLATRPPAGSQVEPTPTPRTARLLTWEDPAGFRFAYPAEIKIDPHPEDKINYANLDLTNPATAGGIKVLVQDNIYKNLDDWSKKQPAAGGQVLDSFLGDKLAKKAIFASPRKIIIAAIDAEALVLLEADLGEGDYWTQVYNDVVSSFEFIPLAKSDSSSGPPAGGGVIEEEEEVIE